MNPRPTNMRGLNQRAFTLLEILLTLAIFSMLVGGMMGIAGGGLKLQSEANTIHAQQSRQLAFLQHLEHAFQTLPAEARIDLQSNGSGQELAFLEHPSAFRRAGRLGADEVVLRSERTRNGLEIFLGWAGPGDQTSSAILFEGLGDFRIELLDAETGSWIDTWDEDERQTQRPLNVRISIEEAEGFREQSVVWVPPSIPPSSYRRRPPANQPPPPSA